MAVDCGLSEIVFVHVPQTSKPVSGRSGTDGTEMSASAQRQCHFTVVDSLLNLMRSEVQSVTCTSTL